jgi:hypothetical protein
VAAVEEVALGILSPHGREVMVVEHDLALARFFFCAHEIGGIIRVGFVSAPVSAALSRVKPFENVTLGLSVETFEM